MRCHWSRGSGPGDPTSFFVGRDLVLCTSVQGDGDIAVLARSDPPDAVRYLAESHVEWDHLEDD